MVGRASVVGGLLCLTLAGCWSGSGADGDGQERIECAIGAGAPWRKDCPVERIGDLLTVRHADGGFRRFRVMHDGQGIGPADGSEQVDNVMTGKAVFELGVGEDRYRFPLRFTKRAK